MPELATFLISVFVFAGVICIHEAGHFGAACLSKVFVTEFSIGMGPLLLSREKGGIKFSLRLLPVGGYVSMPGESGYLEEDEQLELKNKSAEHGKKLFSEASAASRLLIVSSGAIMNFILGFFLLLVLVTAQPVMAGKTVAYLEENSTCAVSGLKVGDEIICVNGNRCYITSDIVRYVAQGKNHRSDLIVNRDNKTTVLHSVLFEENVNGSSNLHMGFKVGALEKTPSNIVRQTGNFFMYYSRIIIESVRDMFFGRVQVEEISGPVGIVSAIHEAVAYGWQDVVSLMALITINLGVVNLLPIPALDGGRFVLILWERITGHKVSDKLQTLLIAGTMALLFTLLIFVSFHDVLMLLSH